MTRNQFLKLKKGDVVYDCHSIRMGNTTMRTLGLWEVVVVRIEPEKEILYASWNTNPVEAFYHSQWKSFRIKKPKLIRNAMGISRLAKKNER